MLEQALAMSMEVEDETSAGAAQPDIANMTEEEQIAFAMQMSMQDASKHFPNLDKLESIFCKTLLLYISVVL